jgi:hypothetical protein
MVEYDDWNEGTPDEGVTPVRPTRDRDWFTGNTSYSKGWWE